MTKKDTPKEPEIPKKPDMPRPVSSIDNKSKKQPPAGNPPAEEPVNDTKIQTSDSDQSNPPGQSPHTADQIDAGDSKPSTTSSESPALPPNGDPAAKTPKKEIPALPFDKDDVMAGKPPEMPVAHPPAVVSGGATPAVKDRDLDKQMADKKTAAWLQNQGSEYKVQGNYRPDAASVQGAANKNKVSTEILKVTQTKEYAEVIVRTYYCGQYVDTVVHHDFEYSKQIKLIEMATKHPETVHSFSSDGMPVFNPDATFKDQQGKTKNLMLTVMHTLLADIQFSIRDATTKASAAGQAKILNQDWQGEEEKASEAHEREMIEVLKDH